MPETDRRAPQLDTTEAFAGTEDLYGGFVIDASSLPADVDAFAAGLAASLRAWRDKYAGVWLKIPLARAACVPLAAEQGFQFHHAEAGAEAGYVMMTRWLPSDRESTLPPNASHQVGVGACVFNARGELLVVRERHGPAARAGWWKVPTGLVHCGEDIAEGVVREVLEETGLEVEFDGVLAMRQAHGFAFGKSDMFFLCGLRPSAAAAANCSVDGRPRLQACLKEVEEVRWLPLEEYCNSDLVRTRPTVGRLARCMSAYATGDYKGFKPHVISQREGRTPELVLHGSDADLVMPKGWEGC